MTSRPLSRVLLLAVLAVLFASCAGSDRRSGAEATGSRSRDAGLRWQRDGIGMSSSFLPSGGRLLAGDGERVYVASGFGDVGIGQARHTVTALDRDTGRTRWIVRRSAPSFLQGVVDGVVLINEQYNLIVGAEAATGTERWTLDLESIGLVGYGAAVSAISSGVVAVGLSARGEGNTGPPVIAGIDPTNGQLRWQTVLTPGTDLNFGTPAVAGAAAVFLSTPSHPGSASGNMAHAVDLDNGAVRWSVDLGGGQGFHAEGAAVSPGAVHIPASGGVITVDPTTGAMLWRRETGVLPAPAVVGDRLWVLTTGGIDVLDAATGGERADHRDVSVSPGGYALIALPERRVVLAVDRVHGRAVNSRTFAVSGPKAWPAPLVDVPLVARDLLVVASGDLGVAAYEIRKLSSNKRRASTATAPPTTFTGEAARVANAVAAWLNADTVEGGVAHIEDGEQLRSTIREVTATMPRADYSGRVDQVNILGANQALIVFTVLSDGKVVLNKWEGRAVRVDGKWKVSRDTYCQLISFSGVQCPQR